VQSPCENSFFDLRSCPDLFFFETSICISFDQPLRRSVRLQVFMASLVFNIKVKTKHQKHKIPERKYCSGKRKTYR